MKNRMSIIKDVKVKNNNIKELLEADNLFFIDTRNIERLCQDKISRYRVLELPVGKILREQEVTGHIIPMEET